MQNVQRWSENVMKYDDFDGRMLIELDDVSSRKIMENRKNEVGNCSLVELTCKQNAENEQLDSDSQKAANWRLMIDGWNSLSMTMNEMGT